MNEKNIDRNPRPNRPVLSLLLASFVLLPLGCSKVNLYSDLPERQANEMMAVLLEKGVDCAKEPGDEEQTWKLLVHVDDFTRSVNALDDLGYPNDKRQSMGEMFKKTGLVSSPTEDRIRYVYALSEELAETISRIDGVIDARVHVVLPNNDPFSDHVRPSSASAYIKHRDDTDMTTSRDKIKELVAKSIEGLETKNVEVFFDEVQTLLPPAQDEIEFERVLGIALQPGSVNRFWQLVGGLAAVAVINLILVLCFAFRKHLHSIPWFHRGPIGGVTTEAAAS